MTFTPEQLEQVAAKQRGDAIRSSDWNIVVDEVQELGEQTQNLDNTIQELGEQTQSLTQQTQNLDNTKVNRNGDTITGSLNVEGDLRVGTNSRAVSVVNGTLSAGSVTMTGTTWQESGSGEVIGNVFPLSGRVSGITDNRGNPRDNLAIGGDGNISFLPGRRNPSGSPGEEITMRWDGNVGIGTREPSARLEVVDSSRSGNNENILALRYSNRNRTNLRGSNRFIDFLVGDETVGHIQGLGTESGNFLFFAGSSRDYAEYLPRLKEDEVIEAGDIVGVFSGKVSKTTENAHHFMAITDRPIVLGNMPVKEQEHLYEQVSFIGQIPIKVRGSVQAGDYIIPSGLNDGTGIAVAPQDLTPTQCGQIVGRAWESSDDIEVKRVNTAVGLDTSSAVATSLMSEIATLKAELQELKRAKSLV